MNETRRSRRYSKDNSEKDCSTSEYKVLTGEKVLKELKRVESQIASDATVTSERVIYPFIRKMGDWEWIIDTDYMYKDKPMKEKLVGNWFLCRCRSGELFITKDKPKKVDNLGSFMLFESPSDWKSGWLALDIRGGNTFIEGEYEDLRREDFLCLDFPEVTYENSPLEIAVMPSGNVYFY